LKGIWAIPVLASVVVIAIASLFVTDFSQSSEPKIVHIPSSFAADAASGNTLTMSIIKDGVTESFPIGSFQWHAGYGENNPDKLGRVKVCFPLAADENSSCWIRVSMPYSTDAWEMFLIPAIGDEVRIIFVDGDPDRPLVIGAVYNGVDVESVDVKASESDSPTMEVLMTATGHELVFEDSEGAELLCVQADAKKHEIFLCDESGPR